MFYWLNWIEDSLWAYLCFPAILIVGGILTWESRLFQIRKFPHVVARFYHLLFLREPSDRRGVHPLKAFFASVGGCVGIGNIVGICTGVQIGGPGALFWVWCTALLGVIVKYAEVYLGIKYRELSADGGYNGGPMYFLQRVCGSLFFPKVVCLLLCIYGVEIYQFSIIAHNVSINFHWNPYLVIGVLLAMVIFAGSGGVRRVGNISSAIIPFFVLLFLGMGIWVLILHAHAIPEAIADVFRSAFTGHAAIGGFVGSGIMMTVSQGIRRACYSGDIGIGYASVIHSETAQEAPEKQASLVLFDIFLDTFVICTMSLILILVTGVWHQPIDPDFMLQTVLDNHFPYMNFFMPLFLFLLGYSTINAYFVAGLKCAQFLAPNWGRPLYYLYAVVALIFFSFFDPTEALTVMSLCGGLLLVINITGIFFLRKEVHFNI